MISTRRVAQVIALASLCQALDLERWYTDVEWPEDNCCRLYAANEFGGFRNDYCTDSPGEEKVIDFTWNFMNNEMMSWKCGRNTAANFCDKASARLCDTHFSYGESAGGGAES